MEKLQKDKKNEKITRRVSGNLPTPNQKKLEKTPKIDESPNSSSSPNTSKGFTSKIPVLKSKTTPQKLKVLPQKLQKNPEAIDKAKKEIGTPKEARLVSIEKLDELVSQNKEPRLVFNSETNEVEFLFNKSPKQEETEQVFLSRSWIAKFSKLVISSEDSVQTKKDQKLSKSLKARRSGKNFHRKVSKSFQKFKEALNRRLSGETTIVLSNTTLEDIQLGQNTTNSDDGKDAPDSDFGTMSERQTETPENRSGSGTATTTSETPTDSGCISIDEDIQIIRELPKPVTVDIFDDIESKNETKEPEKAEQSYDLLEINTPENTSTCTLISEEELRDIAAQNAQIEKPVEDQPKPTTESSQTEVKSKVSFDASIINGKKTPALKPTAPEFVPESARSTYSRPSTSSYVESSSRPSTSGSSDNFTSSTTILDESKSFTYSIENEDKLLNIKTIISGMAFQTLPPCPFNIRPDLIRQKPVKVINLQKNEEREDNASAVEEENVDIIEFEGRQIKINRPPEPKSHAVTIASPNIIQTIDRLENMLEMLLMMGFNITRGVKDKFKPQEVPLPIHTAMTDVRGFLRPIKQKLKFAVENGDGVYFQPFADCVNASINPAYHQINDAIVALESPMAINHRQLASLQNKANKPYEEPNLMNSLNDFVPTPKTPFMNPPMGKILKGIPNGIPRASGARVNPLGLIELPFQYDLWVILTMDLGIMVFTRTGRVHIALSATEVQAGLHFRYGQVYQTKHCINFNCMDELNQISKMARITDNGVIFQDEFSPSTYMTTPGGTITCSRMLNNIFPTFISEIFYSGSRCGNEYVKDCVEILRNGRFDFEEDGSLSWVIQNVKIKQSPDGQLVVHKKNAAFTMVITPRQPQDDFTDFTVASRLTTPRVHATSSLTMRDEGNLFHMYGKCQSKKVFYSNEKFVVRCQTQTAGIDENHAIRLHMT